ncbi:Phosphomannomutase [Rubellimicrobium mesophilum DSM 19309]|uniref:Phosphomannomutase n=1 Tax=Rubellimicrobium mesophilum DSM 19309 TaxID=442562 RepID=A0A017HM88_9RHOB|nr:phosphomannomutase/phosphoglucomutase [Rubellimicrobium mesophilum]EYD75435.1 Phosphomannomutase [Rubellimicrobium mesophilum DSM 19309]
MTSLTCFKAYDIRGRLGPELDDGIARRIGRAFAEVLDARRVVLGRDIRPTSGPLMDAVAEGLVEAGVEVLDLGLCGTEEMYWATTHFGADGGIEVTASHNPIEYNGLKMVRAGSAPIGADTGLSAIKVLAESAAFAPPRPGGTRHEAAGAREAYVARVLSFIDPAALRPLTILVNAGNGAAGPTFDALAEALEARGAPLRFVRMHHEPDGSFPHGIPNPLLPENQPVTARAVLDAGADMGIAWDGDFDRCFLFDERGRFIPGEYVVGLLAEAFLAQEPGATVVHDPRVVWNTQDIVARAGGRAVQARTGHAFLKQALRDTGAVYGGEMSAHHYFRDFASCDSGMIPWLLVAALMSRRDAPLSDLWESRRQAFPSSGEINFRVEDARATVARIVAELAPLAESRDDTDGTSLSFGAWRFNLRSSNTEPLLRLNVEAKGDERLVEEGVRRVTDLIRAG